MEQNPSMDTKQVERHACSDRHAHNTLLNKASDTEVIEYNGTLRKVKSVSNMVLSFMKPEDRIEAETKLKKKRKKVILREARETIALGKLIGACTVGNEEENVKDIAHLIEARGHAL
ncbi:hypothetical protein V6N13_085468 [Hibiscus sabdariffa]